MTKSRRRQNTPAELARAIAAGDFPAARRILRSAGAGGQGKPGRVGSAAAPGATWPGEVVGGCEATATVGHAEVRYHAVSRTLDQWMPADGPDIRREVVSVLRGARRQMDELDASPALCHAANADPEDLLFVSPWPRAPGEAALVLIGVLFCHDRQLVVEHYVAPDEQAEAGICQAFAERHARAAVLVTFSGRRSHRKHLADRCARHGVDLSAEAWDAPAARVRAGGPAHLDLRKECRARWRGQLPACTLGVLERRLLGRSRPGLVRRAVARQACGNFADTGGAAAIGQVLAHCAADLAAMAQLVCILLTGCETDIAP